MENTTENNPAFTYRIGAAIVVALIAFFAFAWYISRPVKVEAPYIGYSTSTPNIASSTESGLSTTGGAYTVSNDDIVDVDLPTPPDFRAPVQYASDVTPEVRAAVDARVQVLVDKLAKDSFDLGTWIDLGTMRKIGGDWKGAEMAWLFVTKAAPKNPMAFSNLADLYMNFLKDYPKADAMYKKVNALAPDAIDAYISRSVLYESFYKAGGNPEAALKQGLTANPKSVELELALAHYYTRAGRPSDAKTAYQAAINIAQADGNTTLVSQIKSEAGIQ